MLRAMTLGWAALLLLAGTAVPAQAVFLTTTFDSSDPGTWNGITLGGNMTWSGVGGGHLFNEGYSENDFLFFSSPTTVVSWEMTNRPFKDYEGGVYGKIDVEAFDLLLNSLWFQTVDLTNNDWDHPLTVIANVNNVSSLTFHAPGLTPHNNAFWPSIDNMTIDLAAIKEKDPTKEPVGPGNKPKQPVVPEPTSLALAGLAGIGMAVGAWRRRQQEVQVA